MSLKWRNYNFVVIIRGNKEKNFKSFFRNENYYVMWGKYMIILIYLLSYLYERGMRDY